MFLLIATKHDIPGNFCFNFEKKLFLLAHLLVENSKLEWNS